MVALKGSLMRLVALAATILSVTTGQVQSDDGVGVLAVAHGVTVSLLVPRTRYPRDALIQATVTVRNDSGSTIMVPTSCDNNNPGIEVLRHDVVGGARFATRVYPPALPQWLMPPCSPVFRRLASGESFQNGGFVVLVGGYVRGFAVIAAGSEEIRIATPQLHVHLSPSRPPRVTMHTTAPVHATIHRPQGAAGPLLYVQYSACPLGSGSQQLTGQPDWRIWATAPTDTLTPGCARPTQWDVLAGWPGFSVARIVYPPPKHRRDEFLHT